MVMFPNDKNAINKHLSSNSVFRRKREAFISYEIILNIAIKNKINKNMSFNILRKTRIIMYT